MGLEKIGSWATLPAFTSPKFSELGSYIAQERSKGIVYPDRENIFRAFELTPLEKVKVVLIGQDPYHDGSATGLCFECGAGKITPSWEKVIQIYDKDFPTSFAPDIYEGKLSRWAEQGVLLLNAALTVRKGQPGSHSSVWKGFTLSILGSLYLDQSPKVFMVWGKEAQKLFPPPVDHPHHGIYVEHPAAAVYANREWNAKDVFIRANIHLKRYGLTQIDW